MTDLRLEEHRIMEHFTHKVAAIYRDQSSAREAWNLLRRGGFPEEQMRLVGPTDS